MPNEYGYFRIRALPKESYKTFKQLVKTLSLDDDAELVLVMLQLIDTISTLNDQHGKNIGKAIIRNAITDVRMQR